MLSKVTLFSFFIFFSLCLSAAGIHPTYSSSSFAEVSIHIEYDAGGSIFVESCNAISGKLIFTFEPVQEERRYVVTLSGAAQKDVDYTITGLTDTLIVPAGETILEFPVLVIADGIPEGTEDLVITVADIPGGTAIASYTTSISDFFEVTINDGQDVTACLGDEIVLTASPAATYLWIPPASVSDPSAASVLYTSLNSGEVDVTATLGTCDAIDKINITIINSSVILTASKDTLCGVETVSFTTATASQNGIFTWQPASLFPDQNAKTQTVSIDQNTDVIVSYTYEGCTSYDTVRIRVRPGLDYVPPFTDTTVCSGEKLEFGDFSKAANYEFIPINDIDFTNPNHPFLIATKDASYKVRIKSTDGGCIVEHDFNITVNDGHFNLKTPDYVELCKGDSTRIEFSYSPNTSAVVWTPNDSTVVAISDSAFYAKPTVTTTYTGTFTVGDCIFTRSVTVRVDSIPEIPLDYLPQKPFYCKGELISFFSPNYDKLSYPDITFDWGQPLGGIDPYDQLNLTVITQDTFLYIRKTTNKACVRLDSIQIDVKIPLIQFSLSDTLVCANEPVAVHLTTDMQDLEWDPMDGVVCSNDCKSAIITTPFTQTFSVTGKSDGCPGGGSMTIRIRQPVIGLTVTDTIICPNEPVEVSVTTAATNLSWSPGELVSCNNCATTTITTSEEQTLVVSGIQDGCPAYGGIIVRISPPLAFEIKVTPAANVAIGNQVTAAVVDPIAGASYQWKINGRDLGIHGDSYEIVVESDNDLIEAILISGQGGNYCTGSGSTTVAGVSPYIDVPNAFTPNGDSKNDVFKAVVPDGVRVLEMTILNRWGQKVFSEQNSNNGWDGRFNDKDAPSDTYVFIVRYQLSQGGVIESRRGEVTLYR